MIDVMRKRFALCIMKQEEGSNVYFESVGSDTNNSQHSHLSFLQYEGARPFFVFEKESCIVHNIYTKQEEGFFLICPSRTNHYQQQ